MSDTIAAIATGASVSAIGIVRISGEEAIRAVDALFVPERGEKMSFREDRKLVFGRLFSRAGKLLDLCLCTVSHAPCLLWVSARRARGNLQSVPSSTAGWS